jgi:hypothetical protein
MGRWTTGIATAEGATRIEMSYFVKNNVMKWGLHSFFTLKWTNGSSIGCEVNLKDGNHYLRLKYFVTGNNKEGKQIDYYIQLYSVPSNLGKGEVFYFLCPSTCNYCRVLYRCYGSEIFKSRKAYRHRIYYNLQSVSKYDYALTRYFQLEKRVEQFEKQVIKTHYKGQETRNYKRLEKMKNEMYWYDELRWKVLANRFKITG